MFLFTGADFGYAAVNLGAAVPELFQQLVVASIFFLPPENDCFKF